MLDRSQQKQILGGGSLSNVPVITIGNPPHYPDCPNVWVQCDGNGDDCRAPWTVNQFGRCVPPQA